MSGPKQIVALSGGIGGAKLALGLSKILPGKDLAIVVNTGDDFKHLGLHVSPDIDTLIYTLAGINNTELGWGRAEETWSFMSALGELGGETWFQFGDKDLAVNVLRTYQLSIGKSLSDVTNDFAKNLGVSNKVIPMSDDSVRTKIETDNGVLDFQDYFVRQRCVPIVKRIFFDGVETAKISSGFFTLLDSDDIGAIVLCPSNPFLSMEPILGISDVRARLAKNSAPVIGVSPIVSGSSIKGPTSKIMKELGLTGDAYTIAHFYKDILDGWIIDDADKNLKAKIEGLGIAVATTNIVMNSLMDRKSLAQAVLTLARQLRR